MADMVAFGTSFVVPDLAAKASIDGPNIVGHCEVEDAVYFQGGRFDRGRVRLKDPGESERADVFSVDLVEVSATRIVPL
jgi:hypothetical protein